MVFKPKKIKKIKEPEPETEEEPEESEEPEEEEEEEEEETPEQKLPPLPASKKKMIEKPNRQEIEDTVEGHLLRATELIRLLRGAI